MGIDRMLRREVDDDDFKKWEVGVEHFDTGRYDDAIRVLTELVAELPPGAGRTMEADTRKNLGFAYLKKGDDARGMRELEAARALYRDGGPQAFLAGFELDVDMFLQEYYGLRPQDL